MKKQHDWMDYANLAANVSQAAQLSELRKSGLAQMQAADAERKRAEAENALRNLIFDWETKLDDAKSHLQTRPTHTHFVADLIGAAVVRGPLGPESFSHFADKDRFRSFMRKLDQCKQESRALINDSDFEKYTEYARHAREHEVLELAIRKGEEVKAATDRLRVVRQEAARLAARQSELKGAVDKTPLIIGGITGLGILGVYASQAFVEVPNPMFASSSVGVLWGGAAVGAVFLGCLVFFWLSGKPSAELAVVSQQIQKLTTEAESHEAVLKDPQVKKIPSDLLMRTSAELKSMKDEREKLMSRWLEAPL